MSPGRAGCYITYTHYSGSTTGASELELEPELESTIEPTANQRHCDDLDRLRSERGERAPTFGLFVCDCSDATELRDLLLRIPEAAGDWIREVVVMLDDPAASFEPDAMPERSQFISSASGGCPWRTQLTQRR